MEEVTNITLLVSEIALSSSSVENEVSSNIDLITNLNPTTPVSGRDCVIMISSNRK